MKKYDVIIIGAGNSGLTVRKEVAKKTRNYSVIYDDPFGITCARVGCMPSKVLIQVANDFTQTKKLESMQNLDSSVGDINNVVVINHVRFLRGDIQI